MEKEQVCSAVYFSTDDHPKIELRFTLTSVETENLEKVEQRFFQVLQEAMLKELDMTYIKECIDRQRRTWKFATESSASSFAEYVLSDFLYGKRDGSTMLDVATLKEYDILEKWTEIQWRDYIKKWMAEAPHVTVLGVPSLKMAETLKKEEEARVAAQKKRLGEKGLKELGDKLEKAKAENDKEIPSELLKGFRTPGIESIHFMDTTTARSGAALQAGHPSHKIQKLVDTDDSSMPLFIHFEHIESNFVQLYLLISAQSVPVQLRPLLSVFTEAFFNLPIYREGQIINFEQVVVELERDTVGYSMESGRILGNSEMLRVSFKVELEKYTNAITWLRELCWNSVFDVERLRAITSRLLADVPDAKRSGDDMLAAVHVMIHYASESIVRARSTLVKARYLKRIKRELAETPEVVVARMEEIRKALFQFENIRVLVVADLEKLKHPVSSWRSFAVRCGTSTPLKPITGRRQLLSEAGKKLGGKSYVVPMPTVDSSFAYASARGLDSYDDPRLPALLVAIAYMNAVEGPLWVAVRGKGLAYGTNFAYNIDTGYVNFDVYRSPNAHKAFESSKQIVEDHLSGAIPFDPLMLEGAISSIVVSFANEQATVASAALGSFIRQVVRNLPSDYKEKMLKRVKDIPVEEVKGALRDIILPLFSPTTANIVVTCATVMEEVSVVSYRLIEYANNAMQTITQGFKSSGFKPTVQSLKEFEDDYGLKGDEEDDEDDEDEEYETGSEEDVEENE